MADESTGASVASGSAGAGSPAGGNGAPAGSPAPDTSAPLGGGSGNDLYDGPESTPTGESEPAPAPETPAQPAAPVFSDEHYRWGEFLGMDRATVDAFGDRQKFEALVHRANQAIRQQAEQTLREQIAAAQQRQQQQPEPWKGFEWPKAEGEYENVGLDPRLQQFGDFTNKQFQALHEKLQKYEERFGQYEQYAAMLHQQQQQAREQEEIRQYDAIVSDEDAEIFGKGSLADVTPAQQDARRRLAVEVSRLAAGYQSRREQVPPLKDLVKAAHRYVHFEQLRDRELAGLSQQSAQRRQQTTAPPARRQGAPETGDQRAARLADEALKKLRARDFADTAASV